MTEERKKIFTELNSKFTTAEMKQAIHNSDVPDFLKNQTWMKSVLDSWLFDKDIERVSRGNYRKLVESRTETGQIQTQTTKAVQTMSKEQKPLKRKFKHDSIFADCCPKCLELTRPELVYPAKGALRALYVCDDRVHGWNTWFSKDYPEFIKSL